MVGSLNDYQKERQFQSLNEQKEIRGIKVIRSGLEHVVDIRSIVVGDVCILEPGEIIPCDGVFLEGHNVKCDESGATGESDAIKKVGFEECIERKEREREGGACAPALLGTPVSCHGHGHVQPDFPNPCLRSNACKYM